MKSNPLLKYLVVPLLLLTVFIGIKMMRGGPEQQADNAPAPKLTAEQAKALGVEGDTPSDTLRTVVAEGRELKQQITDVMAQNSAVKQDNEALKQRLANIDQTVEQRLKNAQEQFKLDSQQQQQSVLDGFKKQMDELTRMGQNGATNRIYRLAWAFNRGWPTVQIGNNRFRNRLDRSAGRDGPGQQR